MFRPTQAFCAFALMLLLTCAGYVRAEETKGTIKSVDTGKHEVVVSGTIRNTIYELNKDGFVCLDGVKSKLADLREGDHAVIVYEKQGEHFRASEIRGLRDAKEATGTVRGTFAEKREITIKGVIKDTTYELDKNATVWLNGNMATIADIREGDQVLVTYQQKGDHNMAACVRAARK